MWMEMTREIHWAKPWKGMRDVWLGGEARHNAEETGGAPLIIKTSFK